RPGLAILAPPAAPRLKPLEAAAVTVPTLPASCQVPLTVPATVAVVSAVATAVFELTRLAARSPDRAWAPLPGGLMGPELAAVIVGSGVPPLFVKAEAVRAEIVVPTVTETSVKLLPVMDVFPVVPPAVSAPPCQL